MVICNLICVDEGRGSHPPDDNGADFGHSITDDGEGIVIFEFFFLCVTVVLAFRSVVKLEVRS